MEDRLDTLLAELHAWTDYDREVVDVGLADSMPTVHGFPTPVEAIDRAMSEPYLESRGRSANASELGLDSHVFYWLGSAAYESPDVIFVWDPQADASGAEAAPWDTGGLMKAGPDGRGRTLDEARHLLDRYSLPSPLARRYLAHVIVACFREPSDYVAGVAPRRSRSSRRGPWYPGRVSYAAPTVDPASHTFEVRKRAPAAIDPHLVAIVVDPGRLDPKQLRQLRARARDVPGCELIQCMSGERPHQRTRRYIDRILKDVGALQ